MYSTSLGLCLDRNYIEQRQYLSKKKALYETTITRYISHPSVQANSPFFDMVYLLQRPKTSYKKFS